MLSTYMFADWLVYEGNLHWGSVSRWYKRVSVLRTPRTISLVSKAEPRNWHFSDDQQRVSSPCTMPWPALYYLAVCSILCTGEITMIPSRQ